MKRIELSEQKYKELFGEETPALMETDPEFQTILNRFIFGEVCWQGVLDEKQRELITLVVLTVNQTIPQLNAHTKAAMNIGLSPEEIKEAIYQCTPYIGFPKTLNAIHEVNAVMKEYGVCLPLKGMGTVTEHDRFEKGFQVQTAIFGEVIQQGHDRAPANQKHIQNYLSAFCFGDFYTRDGLELKTRELLTLCMLSAQGGCENQVKAHVQGNLNVGNEKEILIAAITHCLPYIGFPRTLNALGCINEVIPEP